MTIVIIATFTIEFSHVWFMSKSKIRIFIGRYRFVGLVQAWQVGRGASVAILKKSLSVW